MKKWTRMNYYPAIPLGKDGKRVTGSEEHIAFSRKAASEGMVLLKNENKVLPIKKGEKVAIFGKAQIDYVRGGGGSGEVYSEYERNIYEGFKVKEEEGKVKIFHKLSKFYESNLIQAQMDDLPTWYSGNIVPGKAPEPDIPEELIKEAKEFADIAIITICRYSGEGWDRSSEKGDFCLNEAELKMVQTACENFDRVIALLNVGGMIDTEWFKNSDKIGASLLMWNAGMEGGLAAADIVCGDVNPSGKLTDTFAKSFDDYPSSENFNDSEMFVKYHDDIYVGYRYFETIPGASEKVNYPFGFGLSYTTFKISDIAVCAEGDKICAEVSVTNTGDRAGREVVQLYYSAPQGKLGKAARSLAAFKKTALLNPGEKEKIKLSFKISDMASYDDFGKCQKSAYILEGGEYSFHIGNSVRNTVKADYTYVVNEEYTVTEQLTEKMTPMNLVKRLQSDGTYEDVPYADKKSVIRGNDAPIPFDNTKGKINLMDVYEKKATLDEFIAQLPESYMAELLGGKPGKGVANTGGIGGGDGDPYGVPCAMTADGPAGVRIRKNVGIPTTSFPCATLFACSWDPELMEEMGKLGAMEAKENNLMIWLTPGMNIHRSPLCGRNFEYFSEDPLIAGKMAAAKVRGIQSQNVAATPKHFAANNKEVNRKNSDSIVSERALREIYLKGFEICVREASPRCIMTSYNIINGTRASENYEMLTDILRGEWGFNGLVMTDWNTFGHHGAEMLAGNDVRMPAGYAQGAGCSAREEHGKANIQQCVKRVLQLLLDFE